MISTRACATVFLSVFALAGNPARALEASAPILATESYSSGPAFGPCTGPSLSTTGRYLTFFCASNDIVPGDGNQRYDTFILDNQTRDVERISVDSSEQEYRFDSGGGFPSVDGRFVVFLSAAPLHPDLSFPYTGFGYTNPFLRDRLLGTTELLGRSQSGGYAPQTGSAQLNSASYARNLVLFSTESNMLDATPPPASRPIQLYARNWISGIVELVTATPNGEFSVTGASSAATLSPDGRYVAFLSYASDLNSENPTGTEQLMIRDLDSHTTRRLSFPAAGGEFGGAPYYQRDAGAFSWDGRLLAVEASSDELDSDGALGFSDIYVIDTQTRRYELISTGFGSARPNNGSFSAAMSANGRYVAYFSRASNLMATPQLPAIYIKDRFTGELLNLTTALGAPRSNYIPRVSLSADGSTVAFDWRHPDSAPVLGGRTLVYTVALRGTPNASVVQVNALGSFALTLLGFGIALAALGALGQKSGAGGGTRTPTGQA